MGKLISRVIFLAVILCIGGLVGSGSAWGVSVYFSKISGSTYYNATGWPVTTGDTAGDMEAALTVAGAGGLLYLDGGSSGITYSGADIDDADNLDLTATSQQIYGSAESGHDGLVTIDGSGQADYVINDNGMGGSHIIGNMKLVANASASYCLRLTANVRFDEVDFSGGNCFQYATDGTQMFNRCAVHDFTNTSTAGVVNGAGVAQTYNFCKIGQGNFGSLDLTPCGSVVFNNCNLVGSEHDGVIERDDANGSITLNNCILGAAPWENANVYPFPISAGTATANNCLILYNGRSPQTYTIDSDLSCNNCIHEAPRFVSNRKTSILSFCVDDGNAWVYFKTVADLLEAEGWYGTFGFSVVGFLDTFAGDLTAKIAEVQSYYDAGHCIAAHAYSDTRLDDDGVANALYLSHSGAGTVTVDITYTDADDSTSWTGTISLSTGESLTISGDRDSADYKNLNDVVTEFNGAESGNWTCRIPNAGSGDAVTAYSGDAKAVCLAEVTAASTDIYAFNETHLHQVEIEETWEYLNSILADYTCGVFIWPGGRSNETARDKVQNDGLLGARAVTSGDYEIEDLEMYNIYGFYGGYLSTGGASDTVFSRRAASMLFWQENQGFINGIYSHNTGEVTAAQYALLIDEVKNSHVEVMTLSDAVEWVRSNGSTADGGKTYTCTLTDMLDVGLLPSSPCLKTGTKAGGACLSGFQTDGNGNEYYFAPYDRMNMGTDQTGCDADERPGGFGSIIGGNN